MAEDHEMAMARLAGYPDKDVLALVEQQKGTDDCGDLLFEFMYVEAADAKTAEEFAQRLEKAKQDIEAVLEGTMEPETKEEGKEGESGI